MFLIQIIENPKEVHRNCWKNKISSNFLRLLIVFLENHLISFGCSLTWMRNIVFYCIRSHFISSCILLYVVEFGRIWFCFIVFGCIWSCLDVCDCALGGGIRARARTCVSSAHCIFGGGWWYSVSRFFCGPWLKMIVFPKVVQRFWWDFLKFFQCSSCEYHCISLGFSIIWCKS